MHRPDFKRFVFVGVIIAVIVWRVIWPQADLVSRPLLFAIIFLGLLAASFVSSAMEAALTSASKHEELIIQVKRLKSSAIEDRNRILSGIIQDSDEILGQKNSRELASLEKSSKKLDAMEFSISESGRGVSVGAFASLSVFLNVALTAFLPLTMIEIEREGMLGIFYPTRANVDGVTFGYNLVYWDWTGGKMFLFFLVSFPLLLLAKIVPKEIGSKHYDFFAMRLNWLARVVIRFFGWLPAGVLWPFR